MYKIRVNPNAAEDLIETRDYITEELQNPAAALNVVRKIIERYEQLKMFSLLRVDLSSKISVQTDFRYLVAGNYIIFYRVDHEYVYIYRILYAGRDYIKVLFSNEVSVDYEDL